ncbi:Zinc finger protein 618 [Tupaia chinensis]|uniref:Zinc finger protein 618 n=1 Tax=Tupaia chinensis TaxID=246437 RepID=L9L6U3_TUPCH|nr:Zinc finger protein 618 [Tupaia chinensis]
MWASGLPCGLQGSYGVHLSRLFFSRERLKRSQKSTKVEGPEPVPAEASLSAEQGTMTEVKVKTELPDDYIQEVIWQGEAKEEKAAVGKDGTGDVPAEICVVIGGVRNQQTLEEQTKARGKKESYQGPHSKVGMFSSMSQMAHATSQHLLLKPTRLWYLIDPDTSPEMQVSQSCFTADKAKARAGSYECGICGKKYKYYNCFQTHVRAHRDTEATSGEGASQSNNFRYTCDICGKKYKYYSCFQEHRDLHAVDVFSVEGAPENRADPFDQGVVATDEVKEEPPEPFQKIGPKTGNYTCEFCGKQYKYYTPYQEHVALHAPIRKCVWNMKDGVGNFSRNSYQLGRVAGGKGVFL